MFVWKIVHFLMYSKQTASKFHICLENFLFIGTWNFVYFYHGWTRSINDVALDFFKPRKWAKQNIRSFSLITKYFYKMYSLFILIFTNLRERHLTSYNFGNFRIHPINLLRHSNKSCLKKNRISRNSCSRINHPNPNFNVLCFPGNRNLSCSRIGKLTWISLSLFGEM